VGHGWRAGRNPPSVLGSIRLIGIPAPCADLMGVYYPFHRVGWLFTLTPSILNATASLTSAGRGSFLCQSPNSHSVPRDTTPPHGGWSFLRPYRPGSYPPARQPNSRTHFANSNLSQNSCRFLGASASLTALVLGIATLDVKRADDIIRHMSLWQITRSPVRWLFGAVY